MRSCVNKIILVIVVLLWSVGPVWGARPYKIYTIKRFGRWDIVCDSYSVQKGDYIWQLLRRKGSIAENDFPRFVYILKRFNPHIRNPNKIYPGQEILIPLRQTQVRERQPDAGPRYITIPIIPDVLYSIYKVRSGDCVSKIVAAHLGMQWDHIPEEYFQTFKRLNPDIKNMNRIYPGQTIRISEVPAKAPTRAAATPPKPSIPSAAKPSPSKRGIPWWHQVVSKTIAGLGGKLLASGQCYFPRKGQKDRKDLALDLTSFPVIEPVDGRHLILELRKGLSEDLEKAIRSFWDTLIIIRIDPEEPAARALDKIFRAISGGKVQKTLDLPELDDGIRVTLRGDWILSQGDIEGIRSAYQCITLIENPQERTSAPVVEYLANENIRVVDMLTEGRRENKRQSSRENAPGKYPMLTVDASGQEAFVSEFVTAMGYSYEPRVPFSFVYAGVQIETTANIIHGEEALDVVVDFGTFYGDAKSAIEAGGLKVVSIRPEDEALNIVRDILRACGIPFSEDPVFFAANREVSKTVSLTIPGVLASHPDQGRTLLTRPPLHPKICDFLTEREIKVLKIKSR
jgi:LysM repeat protein